MVNVIHRDEFKDQILNITLIDVRESQKYKRAHIQGAENIPVEQLVGEAEKKYSHEKNITIYGEDEIMGEEAAKKLEEAGFERITLYKEGFLDWRRAHMPVKKMDLGQTRRG